MVPKALVGPLLHIHELAVWWNVGRENIACRRMIASLIEVSTMMIDACSSVGCHTHYNNKDWSNRAVWMRVNYRHSCSRREGHACNFWAGGERRIHWRPWNWWYRNTLWRYCTGSQYRWYGRRRSTHLLEMEGWHLGPLASTVIRRSRCLSMGSVALLPLPYRTAHRPVEW